VISDYLKKKITMGKMNGKNTSGTKMATAKEGGTLFFIFNNPVDSDLRHISKKNLSLLSFH